MQIKIKARVTKSDNTQKRLYKTLIELLKKPEEWVSETRLGIRHSNSNIVLYLGANPYQEIKILKPAPLNFTFWQRFELAKSALSVCQKMAFKNLCHH